MKENVICIIGMHRSGTSMITRVLNLCGLDLGPSNKLMGPHESNPEGHWENLGFFSINESLLSHFGGAWDNPPKLKSGWEYDPGLEPIVENAMRHLKGFSNRPQWGWKDPRTTLLLLFWKSLIPNLRFVICVRSPLEVANSLARRDRIPIQKSIYLWNQYMRAAIRDTDGSPRTFIFYEDLFKDAFSEIDHLVEFCGLKRPENPTLLSQTISRELKHHSIEMADLLNENKMMTEHKLFYIGLRALSVPGLLPSTPGRTREELISENIGRFLMLLEKFHDESEMAKLQTTLVHKNIQLFQLCAAMRRLQRTIMSKVQENNQLSSTIVGLDQQFSEIVNSQSWRVTKPLRMIADHLRSAVNKMRHKKESATFKQGVEVLSAEVDSSDFTR